jgi:hypothetical protein
MEQLAASSEDANAELADYYLSDEFRTHYMKVSLRGALGARKGRGGGRGSLQRRPICAI